MRLVNHPQVKKNSDGSYYGAFPATGDEPAHVITFRGWNELGGKLEYEVATAFVDLFAKQTKLSKEVTRRRLFKLFEFVKSRNVKSLTDLVDEDVKALEILLGKPESTRAKNWAECRRVIQHAFKQAGRAAPQMESNPWARRPPVWSPSGSAPISHDAPGGSGKVGGDRPSTPPQHPRGRLAAMPITNVLGPTANNVGALDPNPTVIEAKAEFAVFFPARGTEDAHRQDFTDWWKFDRAIAQEVAAAAIALKRNNTAKSVTTWRTRIRYLLRYLETIPGSNRPTTLADLTAQQLVEFRNFIDKNTIEFRSKNWNAVTAVVVHACEARKRPAPHFQVNPWPGHAARAPVATLPLTQSEIGAILNACLRAMNETKAASTEPGYDGATLTELFPFVVVLAFWTLFNPETVAGILRSKIRPSVLGRFAIIGEKGRSNTEQVATFSDSDEHPCSPKNVIQSVLSITSPLRGRLPPDKRDFLFIGRVRQLQRAKAEVQAFSEVNSAMISYFRDDFCKKYNLETFSIDRIRVTGATIVNRLFGGDVKTAQILLNHLSIATTDSYVQRDARRMEAEILADQMEKRARFVRSGGMRDVRDQPAAPQSAATPGFVCAAPFDPPSWLDQDAGMCAAYAACPACPLASVDRLSAASFACVLRLRNQIRDAHGEPRMSPHRWIEIWKPRLLAIDKTWLPMFADKVREEAAVTIRDVPLPPLSLIVEM